MCALRRGIPGAGHLRRRRSMAQDPRLRVKGYGQTGPADDQHVATGEHRLYADALAVQRGAVGGHQIEGEEVVVAANQLQMASGNRIVVNDHVVALGASNGRLLQDGQRGILAVALPVADLVNVHHHRPHITNDSEYQPYPNSGIPYLRLLYMNRKFIS